MAKFKVRRLRNTCKKISLEDKLRRNLRLSWFVRAQVGAKIGNLTLLRRLRCTKFALKADLGDSQEDLGGSCHALGTSWNPLGRLLGGSWQYFEDIWRQFGSHSDAWRVQLKRIAKILKNH